MRVTQHCAVFSVQCNIVHVVQIGKNGYVAKLGNARYKKEPNVIIAIFYYGVKILKNLTVFFGFGYVVDVVDNRFVVFVDENDDFGGAT